MNAWAQVLSHIQSRISEQSFETWFRPIVCAGQDGATLRLHVPNEEFRRWLLDNYGPLLSEAIRHVSPEPLELDVRAPGRVQPAEPMSAASSEGTDTPFIPKYTFDTFVVGPSNQFARAAAGAVAERPSRTYNPLYIYGGVGLGKTHLLHAIGHLIRRREGQLRVAYMSAERFMNELVNAIRYDRTMQFRQKYRTIDVLLMDDIQFLAGKERTQEEFFHTFNALYDSQRQIVISSDCPPREIPTLQERLHSRFEWGLIADIQPPDLETKMAILKRKAESERIELRPSVTLYVAGSIRSNIRELEGALTRLIARASLDGLDAPEIDVEYTREVLRNLVSDEQRSISSETIIRAVSDYYGLKPVQLKSKNNARPVAVPRQVAMYMCKQLTDLSLPQIGKDFGGKHHTTVLHSIRKIDALRKRDPEILSVINKLIGQFR